MDLSELTTEEFLDFQKFYEKVKNHLLSLGLKHKDGKNIDQFIVMVRIREEGINGGSTYIKPKHLHIHFVPDREGMDRFVLDESAVGIDIQSIALR